MQENLNARVKRTLKVPFLKISSESFLTRGKGRIPFINIDHTPLILTLFLDFSNALHVLACIIPVAQGS